MKTKTRTPKVQLRGAYYQQLHRKCNGELCIIADAENVKILCKVCRDTWRINIAGGYDPSPASDWVAYNPEGK